MKKLLNTLYVNQKDCYIHKERETIVIKQGETKLGQFPALNIGNIVCLVKLVFHPF